jgi:uncharacterized protein YceK
MKTLKKSVLLVLAVATLGGTAGVANAGVTSRAIPILMAATRWGARSVHGWCAFDGHA